MRFSVTFEVCSACQFDCALCAHHGIKSIDPQYHMSMEQLETFITATEKSGYIVDLFMHGPGEPLLWKHLPEGLTRLRASKAIGIITVNSNGLLLPKSINILELVDFVGISLYPESKMELVQHPKVVYNPHPYFVNKEFPATIPCTCLCSGPMIYKDLVFPDCGPPLFDAVERMGNRKDPLSFGVKLAPHYANRPKTSGNFRECAYCWSNSNCGYAVEVHSIKSKSG